KRMMMIICDGSRYRYDISPEYHSSIGGSNDVASTTTISCPSTRQTNRASNSHSSSAVLLVLTPGPFLVRRRLTYHEYMNKTLQPGLDSKNRVGATPIYRKPNHDGALPSTRM